MPTNEETEAPAIEHECSWCGIDIEPEDIEDDNYETTEDGEVCIQCVHNYAFSCRDCGTLTHTDDSCTVGNFDNRVCLVCYEDHYFYCESCDTSWPNEVYGGDGYCESCYSDCDGYDDCECDNCYSGGRSNREGIRRWGDRPDLNFWNRSDNGLGYDYNGTPRPNVYYMGMEIELESAASHVGPMMHEVEDHMFATTDASLDTGGGVEIVTHPHTFDAWNNAFPWGWWERYIHNMVPNQEDYESNGIHIHVSRTAFANKKGNVQASHLYKFMQFIQINQKGMQFLAGRSGNTYCRWDMDRDAMSRLPDAKKDTSTRSYERYRPINTQNSDTIELRFFAGLSDPLFMKRSIQFVHSLVEFTRIGNFKTNRSWEAYAKYIRRYALRYPELAVYMTHNERKLMVESVSSEYEYRESVLPDLKIKREQQRQRVINERRQEIEQEARREEIINDRPPCTCHYCVLDREGVTDRNGMPYPDQWYEQLPNSTSPERVTERNILIREAGLAYRTVLLAYVEPMIATVHEENPTPILPPIQQMEMLIAVRPNVASQPNIASRPSS